jgi:hypothetical protein
VSSRRRSPRRRTLARSGRASAPFIGVVAGVVLVLSVFMPWYATNIGRPFTAVSSSGWESTNFARGALVAGVVLAVAAAALVLEDRGSLGLDPRMGDRLAWIVVAAAVVATLLVAFRLVVMPSPAEFLSRQIGLYLAGAAAVAGIMSGLAQVSARG